MRDDDSGASLSTGFIVSYINLVYRYSIYMHGFLREASDRYCKYSVSCTGSLELDGTAEASSGHGARDYRRSCSEVDRLGYIADISGRHYRLAVRCRHRRSSMILWGVLSYRR
jgi:hypothetical protein